MGTPVKAFRAKDVVLDMRRGERDALFLESETLYYANFLVLAYIILFCVSVISYHSVTYSIM